MGVVGTAQWMWVWSMGVVIRRGHGQKVHKIFPSHPTLLEHQIPSKVGFSLIYSMTYLWMWMILSHHE